MSTLLTSPPAVPSQVGDLLTDLRRVRDEKDRLGEQIKKLNEQELAIKMKLIDFSEATGLSSFTNEHIFVGFKTDMRARVDPEKWPDFFKWAVDTGNCHVCYHQVSNSKLIELMNSGVAMPDGVTVESFKDWNIRRKGEGEKPKATTNRFEGEAARYLRNKNVRD